MRILTGFLAVAVILALGAASAQAVPPACVGNVSSTAIYSDQGALESILVGGGGKLFASGSSESGEAAILHRYGSPGKGPESISTAGPGPGGLAWVGKRLLWGNGNTAENGRKGDAEPSASLYSVNPATKKSRLVSTSLGMANGIVRVASGAVIASNATGSKLDLIAPDGTTTNGWANVFSANGMTVSPDGKYLFANQTLEIPSKIARIEIANPTNVTNWFTADSFAGLDGLTRDEEGNLYAAAWLTGEIWKIDRNQKACVLASGIPQVSSLTFGVGKKRFSRGHLYAADFNGQITQIKGARLAAVPS